MSPFERELRKLIEAEIETQVMVLALGVAVHTHDQYREVVGKITGLRITLDLCQTAQTEADKR